MLKIHVENTCCNLQGGPAIPPTPKFVRLVGAMLALFCALGRLLAVFGASCCVFSRLFKLSAPLGSLGACFWRVWDAFSRLRYVFFHCFFVSACTPSLHARDATKPQFLQCLPPMSVILLVLGRAPKNGIKLVWDRIERSFPHRSCSKLFLERAGSRFGGV